MAWITWTIKLRRYEKRRFRQHSPDPDARSKGVLHELVNRTVRHDLPLGLWSGRRRKQQLTKSKERNPQHCLALLGSPVTDPKCDIRPVPIE